MRIDLLKLICDFLLPSIRKLRTVEFIRSLLSECQKAHNDFELFRLNTLYKVNANASVISLEHHAERELDVKVRITELDGKPFDFLVTVTGDIADEVRLRSLIDLYKLAGKSYTLKLEYVYFSEFTDFACEDLTVTYTAEFTDFACEDNRRLMISATITNKEDRYWILELAAESEVKSMLTVSGHIVLQSGAPGTFNLKIKKGKLSVEHLFGSDQSDPPHAIIENIDPASDEYYDYCINPNNQ